MEAALAAAVVAAVQAVVAAAVGAVAETAVVAAAVVAVKVEAGAEGEGMLEMRNAGGARSESGEIHQE